MNKSTRSTLELAQQARSSVVEHHLDMVVVGGSIPLAPTRFPRKQGSLRRAFFHGVYKSVYLGMVLSTFW